MMDPGLRIRAHGASAVGGRSSNQDAFGTFSSHGGASPDLFVVADGMGGHGGGERASNLALSTLVEELGRSGAEGPTSAEDVLRGAFERVDDTLQKAGRDHPLYEDMGTTLTAAWIRDRKLVFAHAGDSRLYLKQNGHLEQMTEDQNVAYRLYAEGRLTWEEYRESPYRSALLSYVGGGKIRVESGSRPLIGGERFLLLTDGLVENTTDDEITALLQAETEPNVVAEKLVRLAEVRGAKDNVTVLAAFVDAG